MKKLFLSLAVIATFFAATAQDVPDKEPLQGEMSPEMSALKLATDLVKYGYAEETALPLIDALQIILYNPTQPLGTQPNDSTANSDLTAKAPAVSLDFNKILEDAKKFAEGNEQLLALIDQVELESETSSRGAVNGPKRGVFTLGGNRYTDFDVSFVKGYVAEVFVSGDGDTDLDLYVYDSNGNPIASDTDYTDDCYVNWVPKWTGRYTIRVVNRGPIPNNFIILTN